MLPSLEEKMKHIEKERRREGGRYVQDKYSHCQQEKLSWFWGGVVSSCPAPLFIGIRVENSPGRQSLERQRGEAGCAI